MTVGAYISPTNCDSLEFCCLPNLYSSSGVMGTYRQDKKTHVHCHGRCSNWRGLGLFAWQ